MTRARQALCLVLAAAGFVLALLALLDVTGAISGLPSWVAFSAIIATSGSLLIALIFP